MSLRPLLPLALLALLLAPPALALPEGWGDDDSDSKLLTAFLESFINGRELLGANWTGTTVCTEDYENHYSNWMGVGCTSPGYDGNVQKVEAISLPGMGLEGSIPPGGWQLPESVAYLNLSSNAIFGSIPDGNWTFSPLVFDLSNNQLSSSIPSDWSVGGQALHLNLSLNALEGAVPSSLNGGFTVESSVYIFGNQLETWSGNDDFVMDLSHNMLDTLPDPDAWRLSDSMSALDLSHNLFTGPLPSNFSFYYNKKYADEPDEPDLSKVDLSNNKFTGGLEVVLGWPKTIDRINLANNSLSGSLPAEADTEDSYGWGDWAEIYILPGNPGICGKVPDTPGYYSLEDEEDDGSPLQLNGKSAPPCK